MEKIESSRERPPLFSSWSRLYAVVLLNLALQIFLLYLLTKAFQ
jgi:hypothetical protein